MTAATLFEEFPGCNARRPPWPAGELVLVRSEIQNRRDSANHPISTKTSADRVFGERESFSFSSETPGCENVVEGGSELFEAIRN